MKKTALLIAAASLFAAQAFAQTPPGPTDGTNKAPSLPMGSAAKPVGEGSGSMAPMKADAPSRESRAARKAANQDARAAKRTQMKDANKSGEIPSPTVNPKSY
ncbi:hypothetical protein GN316_02015 [Xylophilus sp. Kf1]|nr:hypothetical protein [Xylophilus sp. Kf1]